MMIVAAAFLLAPLAWVTRERQQQMLLAQAALRAARDAELRAVLLAQQSSQQIAKLDDLRANDSGVAKPASQNATPQQKPAHVDDASPTRAKELQRENAELKQEVEILRREVERLKAAKNH